LTSSLFHSAGFSQPYANPFDSERLTPEERRRGEFIHRVLALIEYNEYNEYMDEGSDEEVLELIRQVSDEMRTDYDPRELKEIILGIRGILGQREIKELFMRKSEREVWREREYVGPEGRLFRMDRVVIDRDRVVLLDWKTGKNQDAEKGHEAQMRTYLEILEEIYPGRHLEGWIAYVDLKTVRRIR
jgi:ATP-dependent exoDNAse (exonuclease V) beta subunit